MFSLFVAILLVLFAFCWPQRLLTWSWLELSQTPTLPEMVSSKEHIMGKPYFRNLLGQAKTIQIDEDLSLWIKDRKASLFFPLEDPRGGPTRIVLKLLGDLTQQGNYAQHWKTELEQLKNAAPQGQWGGLENICAALMMASTQCDTEAYPYWIANIPNGEILQKAAAWLQCFPDSRLQQLELHDQTPSQLLPRLYERCETYGRPAFAQALDLCRHHPETYLLWLVDGRPVREDWQEHLWRKTSLLWPSFTPCFVQPWGKGWPALALFLATLSIYFGVISCRSPMTLLALLGLYVGLLCLLEFQMARESVPLQLQWEQVESSLPSPSTSDTQVDPMLKDLDPRSLQLILFFLALQILVMVLSCRSIHKISKRNESAAVRLRLLENEEYLFDLGLYIGLGGTVMSLIFLLMGQNQQGMMAAYTSTLFGILEVALFKIFILRPFRHKLILQS